MDLYKARPSAIFCRLIANQRNQRDEGDEGDEGDALTISLLLLGHYKLSECTAFIACSNVAC